jgi:hypothetical protein
MSQAVDQDLGPECSCMQKTEDIRKSEVLIDDQILPINALKCWVRIVSLFDPSLPDNNYRTVVQNSSSGLCDWHSVLQQERNTFAEKERLSTVDALSKTNEDQKQDVVVWLRHDPLKISKDEAIDRSTIALKQNANVKTALDNFRVVYADLEMESNETSPALIVKNVSPAKILELLNDKIVGRVTLHNDKKGSLENLCSWDCITPLHDMFHLQSFRTKTNDAQDLPVGIQEGRPYNHGDDYDPRVADPWASQQFGIPQNWPDDHPGGVASQMWTNRVDCSDCILGYIHNSFPISVGTGENNPDATTLFSTYLQALLFFLNNGAHMINSSIFYPTLSWGNECNTTATQDYLLLQDYYQWTNDMLFIQAIGNKFDIYCNPEDTLCFRQTNAIMVGGEKKIFSQTENIPYYHGSKSFEIPHVVGYCHFITPECSTWPPDLGMWSLVPSQPGGKVCGEGNSLNAPIVTSLAAMIEKSSYMDQKYVPSSAIRAIIMASADYNPFIGNDASSLCKGCPGLSPCLAYDCWYGAGLIDGQEAFYLYDNNRFLNYWVDSDSWSTTVGEFSCPQTSCFLKGAIAWFNPIDCDPSDCAGDGHVVHDFDLTIEKKLLYGVWAPAMKSTHRESTTEWLQYDIINQAPSTKFRFVLRQVSRSVSRGTILSFSYRADGVVMP